VADGITTSLNSQFQRRSKLKVGVSRGLSDYWFVDAVSTVKSYSEHGMTRTRKVSNWHKAEVTDRPHLCPLLLIADANTNGVGAREATRPRRLGSIDF